MGVDALKPDVRTGHGLMHPREEHGAYSLGTLKRQSQAHRIRRQSRRISYVS